MKTKKDNSDQEPYIIVIPVYDNVDLMDIAAPREIFTWLNGDASFDRDIQIYFVGENETFYTIGDVTMNSDANFNDAHVQNPHLMWVPGGHPDALQIILEDPDSPFTAYVKRASENAEWVCSVCEGAVLLANTGLLDGHDITTHWKFVHCFGDFPKVHVVLGTPRYVKSGNRVTGGGISSAIDQSLFLVELIAGTESAMEVQLTMQYFPNPPVQAELYPIDFCPVPGIDYTPE